MHTDYTYRCITRAGQDEVAESTLEEALILAWVDHVDSLATFVSIEGPSVWLGPKWFREWTARLTWDDEPTEAQIAEEVKCLQD